MTAGADACSSNVRTLVSMDKDITLVLLTALDFFLDVKVKLHENSLEIYKETGQKQGEAISYMNLAGACYNSEDFKKAIEYGLKAKNLLKDSAQISVLKILYSNLSVAYQKIGDYRNARECSKKSDEIDWDSKQETVRK